MSSRCAGKGCKPPWQLCGACELKLQTHTDKNKENVEDECSEMFRDELAQAVHESEFNELVWQALICAYLDHKDWLSHAEAVFEAHGYTPDEIKRYNSGKYCTVCDDYGHTTKSHKKAEKKQSVQKKLSKNAVRRLKVTKGRDRWWIDEEAAPNGIGPVCLFCHNLIDWRTDHGKKCPVRKYVDCNEKPPEWVIIPMGEGTSLTYKEKD